MDIRKLQRAIVDGLEDVKAQNIAVLNTEPVSYTHLDVYKRQTYINRDKRITLKS